MQNNSPGSEEMVIKYLPILLDKHFPIHDPYLDQPHEPDPEPGKVLHYHDTLELGLCQAGSGLFVLNHQTIPFAAGELSVILPGVPHIARSSRQDISRWHFIDIDIRQLFHDANPEQVNFLARFNGPDGFSGLISRSQQSANLTRLILHLVQELKERDDYALLAVQATVASILIELARYADRIQYTLPVDKPDQKMVAEIMPAILYITRHYDQELAIPELAALCRLSVSAFRRRFRQVFTMPPSDYLCQVRIRIAKMLLRQGQYPITEIAGRIGYPTLSSFNRHFRKYTGQSPTAWRRRLNINDNHIN